MRTIALMHVYNEEAVLARTLEHLVEQGIEFYILDNESTDRTPEIVASYRGRGLIGSEVIPRTNGLFRHAEMLRRKELLCDELNADWFMNCDADEHRLPEFPGELLIDSIRRIDREGFNCLNMLEYVFIPTRESPDHSPESYHHTMTSYYLFEPQPRFRLNTWKHEPHRRINLIEDAGHRVRFDGMNPYPFNLPMRHYLFLSMRHFIKKYAGRRHPQSEIERGWHSWREAPKSSAITFPPASTLHRYDPNRPLVFDPRFPRRHHVVETMTTNAS